jgi:diguanylate cyclase (GGDEF)-like protein/PAS domain S-box-containing protein
MYLIAWGRRADGTIAGMSFQHLKDRFSLSVGRDAKDPAEFRAHQFKAVIGITPLMMAGNAINATIICLAFSGKPFAFAVYVWTALIYAMAFTGYYSWRKSNAHAFPSRISARTLTKVAVNSTALGLLWGSLPLIAYPGGDLATKLIIVGFVGGMMGGGSFALYMVPHALVGYLSSIFGCFFLALAMSRGSGDLAVGALVIMYFGSLLAASLTVARMFAASKITATQVEEQASIIGLLLNDFEESASDWLWETDLSGAMTRGAQRFHQATGIAQNMIERVAVAENLTALRKTAPVNGKGFAKFLQSIQTKAPFNELELSVTREDRSEVWFSLSGKPLVDRDGQFTGYRGVASNITNDKLANERIAYLAHNDALTGLVNRAHFSLAIERCFESRRLSDGALFSVFYLDLDGFKLINDTKGHKVGDELLVEVGARMKKALRDNDVVARLGGDEFGILLRHEFSTRYLSALAEKIIEAIGRPFEIDGHIVSVGVSIGIAIAPHDGSGVEALLNSADLGLYRAKEQGKGTFRFFETKMDDIVRDRRILEQELRGALAADQFELHFQPLVSALDDTTSGFEALIRWNHPTRGQVPPSDFIPLAEKTGLICEIGDWVLMEACRTAAAWPEHMTISVNLSPQQFQNRKIVKSTKHALEATGLTPARLELEITESLFVDNTEEALIALNDLKALGVMTSLDDFGTGYSSLSYLLKFPFDKLKIDQSFIRSIEKDKTARDILETIARLGKILNLSVTAEGVENADQALYLSTMACSQMQGFHFGRPIPSAQIPGFLLGETSRRLKGREALAEAQGRRDDLEQARA